MDILMIILTFIPGTGIIGGLYELIFIDLKYAAILEKDNYIYSIQVLNKEIKTKILIRIGLAFIFTITMVLFQVANIGFFVGFYVIPIIISLYTHKNQDHKQNFFKTYYNHIKKDDEIIDSNKIDYKKYIEDSNDVEDDILSILNTLKTKMPEPFAKAILEMLEPNICSYNDYINKAPEEQKMFIAMNLKANYLHSKQIQKLDKQGYGYEVDNPVYVHSIKECYYFLDHLKFINDKKVIYRRVCSVSNMTDKYYIYDWNTNNYFELFINCYADGKPILENNNDINNFLESEKTINHIELLTKVPKGFKFQ